MDNAYFESEAARPMLRPDDYKAQVAIANIGEDGGAKWRAYLVTAENPVLEAIQAAYAARNHKLGQDRALRRAQAAQVYREELTRRAGSKNAAKAALRKAREISPDFVAG